MDTIISLIDWALIYVSAFAIVWLEKSTTGQSASAAFSVFF